VQIVGDVVEPEREFELTFERWLDQRKEKRVVGRINWAD
jgi:hypothetical protein